MTNTAVIVTQNSPSAWNSLLRLLLCLGAGIIFGFAAEKGRVFEPATIRLQMVFERWIMIKMFISAMATSVLVFCVVSILPIKFVRNQWAMTLSEFQSTVNHKNVTAVMIGAFILGVGMTLSGACPGMIFPQFGAWTQNSFLTLLGALTGALVYGIMHNSVMANLFPNDKLVVPVMLNDVLHKKYLLLAIPVFMILCIAVVVLELVIPWQNDLASAWQTNPGSAASIFQEIAWPPFVSGIVMGLMQLVIIMVIGDTLGGSSSYCTIVSQPFRLECIRKAFPYLTKFQNGLANWWQVFFVCGAILGGLISSQLSNTTGVVPGVALPYAFGGGFLLVFGARLASGCTSGHGLSGSGLLMTASLVAVPCMFAGGIMMAFILRAAGKLDELCYNIDCS